MTTEEEEEKKKKTMKKKWEKRKMNASEETEKLRIKRIGRGRSIFK